LPKKNLDYEKLEKQIKRESTYDHEKQMRLFNDTTSALAINAYEIKEVSERITDQLNYRNHHFT